MCPRHAFTCSKPYRIELTLWFGEKTRDLTSNSPIFSEPYKVDKQRETLVVGLPVGTLSSFLDGAETEVDRSQIPTCWDTGTLSVTRWTEKDSDFLCVSHG